MSEFYPYYTKDGSVGLYSKDFNDIYHSATGALTEAYEKFILPSNIEYLLKTKTEIKVLDICYGIGYNTKALLNFLLENRKNNLKNCKRKIFHSENNYAPIYTNNNRAMLLYNEAIYSNNANRKNRNIHLNHKLSTYISKLLQRNVTKISEKIENPIYTSIPNIYIKAIDFDKSLSMLSPFIKTGVKRFKKYNKEIHDDKINKYLNNESKSPIIKIRPEINYLILENLIKSNPSIFEDLSINSLLNNRNLSPFFDTNIKGIFEFYSINRNNYKGLKGALTYLHNIYYQHISLSYKNRLKTYSLQDIIFDMQNDDARKILLRDTNNYNLIFLDAFTPSKCPCLWTLEFFSQLYKHLENDGMLLTYSSSASIRGAMIEAGFKIGQIYNERTKQYFGTIAVKDENLVKYPLSEFNLGLLKTTAGIFYRDKNLNLSNEAILSLRNDELKLSTRESSSHYQKRMLRK